jgi:hypothetical protein
MDILPHSDADTAPQKVGDCDQNADKRQRKSRSRRRLSNVSAARAATLKIKAEKLAHFSNKDLGDITTHHDDDSDTLEDFIKQFVPETNLEYSRLDRRSKIVLAQYVLLKSQRRSPELISLPVTIRLNNNQQLQSDSTIKRSLRRELNNSLGRLPLYWIATHRNRVNKHGTKHFHGEFLVTGAEIPLLIEALKRFYGKNNPGIKHSVRQHLSKRNEIAREYGQLYAHLNWAGYAVSEVARQKYGKHFQGEFMQDHFSSISADLNTKTSRLYEEHIYRQLNYKQPRKTNVEAITERLCLD